MYVNICACFSVHVDSQSKEPTFWESQLFEQLLSNECKYIFFFDNAEYFLDKEETRDTIQNLFISLLNYNYIKVLLTSTTKFQLVNRRRIYHICEVSPLKRVDSVELLRAEAPEVAFGDYLDPIVELSEGIPLLILMIGSELRNNDGLLSPKEMVEILVSIRLTTLSLETFPEEERIAKVYCSFIDRLSPVLKDRYTILNFIPGSFNTEEAQSMLDFQTQATVKSQVLVPQLSRHFLNYDLAKRRFNIQGILRECLNTFYAIQNLPEIRSRYSRTFSAVLMDISRRFHSHEYASALAEFAVEQPNLQKLLAEIYHTTQDTYAFFIQMATECTSFIEKYMPGISEDFYGECKRAASRYGKNTDVAKVDISVGTIYTNVKGDLKEGLRMYKDALKLLEDGGKSVALATVYQRIGYNLMLQDQNFTALSTPKEEEKRRK
ncbi:hypothetical protein DPMN_046486 [Dreissena polymorpha]|uniref:Uncharacterized protein n=1 Tax=Dreissena polymorpha TaxID=45954 RepID=A0A9D4I295_DREPO|nr:hypothetical protein DPMN_046486 [Dreissena polymorpha]